MQASISALLIFTIPVAADETLAQLCDDAKVRRCNSEARHAVLEKQAEDAVERSTIRDRPLLGALVHDADLRNAHYNLNPNHEERHG